MDFTTSLTNPIITFNFPLLKTTEILECLSALGIDLEKKELLEPQRHKEKLRRLFLSLMQICLGKAEDDFQPSPSMMQLTSQLPYPELHPPESFLELQFFTHLRKLMETCGYYDFALRDLYVPESKRLRQQLSAILNFAKFREEQIKVYEELCNPRMELIADLELLNAENLELKAQLAQAEKESQYKAKEMQHILSECEELELEIARNNQLQASSREEAATLKKRAKDLKDELDTATWALEEAEAEEERLRAQVVSSPDRRKEEITTKRERLEKIKQECEELDKDIQDSRTKLFQVRMIGKEIENISGSLNQLKNRASAYLETARLLEEASEQVKAVEQQTAEHSKAIDQAERELHRVEEKITHQRKQHKLEIDAVNEALEDAKSQLLLVEKDRREGMARVEAGETEVRELEAMIEDERKNLEREVSAMVEEYKAIELLFLNRNAQRMAAIKGEHQ